MTKYFISLNPFAEFFISSKAVKNRLIRQQLVPNKFLIPWYQFAKSVLKKYFSNINDESPINEGLETLKKRVPTNKRQQSDKNVSIEALQKVAIIKKPRLLSRLKYEVLSSKAKSIVINGVEIKVAPDLIIKAVVDDQTVYGAVKFHVKKTKAFDLNQAELVSLLLFKFLEKNIAKKDERVLPELCICFDVFSERMVHAPDNSKKHESIIRSLCNEIKEIWPKSA
jgi:hypothetical protein